MIRLRNFEAALATVRRSGVAAYLEERLRSNKGGRPRCLSVEMLLAASIVVAGPLYREATHVNIHLLLSSDLHQSRHRLGFTWSTNTNRGEKQTNNLSKRQVRYLFNEIIQLLDYSPHTSGLNEEERIETEHETYDILNRLVRASKPQAMPTAEYQAIDATAFETWSRLGRNSTKPETGEDYRLDGSAFASQDNNAYDPDARWGHRTATYNNGSKMFFGHKIIAAVGSYAEGSPFKKVKLLTAVQTMPNGAYEADVAMRIIDDFLSPNNCTFKTLTDRAFSSSDRTRWADLLQTRGIEQYMDMNPADFDPRLDEDDASGNGAASGALIFAGWAFVPWTPRHLFNIKRPRNFSVVEPGPGARAARHRSYQKRKGELNKFRAAIQALEPYALIPNGRRDANGDQRFFIPSRDKASATPFQRGQRIFRQGTIRIKHAALGKLHQPVRWGTDAWITAYSHRTDVEGVFGNLKSRSGNGMTRGWIRVVGLTAMAFMATMATVNYNLRMIAKFARENKLTVAALYAAKTTDELLTLLDAAALPPQALAPPRAA